MLNATLLIFMLALSGPTARQSTQQNCLSYDSEVVTLNGRIRTHVFPGQPNYESVAKGDAPEKVWLLQLTKPICTSATTHADAEKDVRALQLVFLQGQKQYKKYWSLKGRRVAATGTLMHAETGHHHTNVLLVVTDIKKL